MSKKNRYTPISSHKRDKSKLKTGLSGLLAPFDWERDLMPEHIWIDLLAEEYKDRPWHKIYESFLDNLEECAEGKIYPFTRVIKHKLVQMPWDEKMIDMLTRYPDGCSEQERYSVQQHARVIMNSQFMMNEAYKDKRWPAYFWRHNLDLVPCSPFRGSLEDGDIDNPEKIKQIHKEIWDN